jgi:hypothetical protein
MEGGKDEVFPLEFSFAAEVEEVTDLAPGDAHIIEKLRLVVACELGDGL